MGEKTIDTKDIFEWSPAELREEFFNRNHLDEINVIKILRKLQEILIKEENVIYLTGDVTVCGDIHGQLYDLFSLFDTTFAGKIGQEKILFMGDYVDRGYQSIETFIYLAFLKIKYPDYVFLLRGNHESRQINQMYGFFADCQSIYGNTGVWYFCNETFDLLPLAAVINHDVYCVHGGLSPKVRAIERLSVVKRRVEIPNEGPIADITWSDPLDSVEKFVPNRRGAGYLFGKKQAEEFCQQNGIKLIARSHQLAEKGYTFNCEKKVITVWSAPNYAYRTNNLACVMHVKQNWTGNTDDLLLQEFKEHDLATVKPEDVTIDYFA